MPYSPNSVTVGRMEFLTVTPNGVLDRDNGEGELSGVGRRLRVNSDYARYVFTSFGGPIAPVGQAPEGSRPLRRLDGRAGPVRIHQAGRRDAGGGHAWLRRVAAPKPATTRPARAPHRSPVADRRRPRHHGARW